MLTLKFANNDDKTFTTYMKYLLDLPDKVLN